MEQDYAFDYIEYRLREDNTTTSRLRNDIERARNYLEDADAGFVNVAINLHDASMMSVPGECTVYEDECMEFGQKIGYAIELLDEYEYYLDEYEASQE